MELQQAGKLGAASASVKPGTQVLSSANSDATARDRSTICRNFIPLLGEQYLTFNPRRNCDDKQMPDLGLTQDSRPANIMAMAYSFLVFDFGMNEELAQQARHKIEGWKQGFRLDKKLQVKFDRQESELKQGTASEPLSGAAKDKSKMKHKSASKSKSSDGDGNEADSSPEAQSDVRLVVRLDFSDHEKLSHQRWLDRIPTEEPFKSAKFKVVRSNDPDFGKTSDLFDSLDKHSGARVRE